MSKSRLVSGRIKKVTGTELSTDRYEFLDLANAEPDLGLPTVDESILIGDVDGSRTWVDIATYAEEFKGYTGSQGNVGFTGSRGTDGFTGSAGFVGSQGPQGNFGGVTFDYTFDSEIGVGDPGAGKLRLNNPAIVSALQLYIHDTDDANANLDAYLTTIDDSTSQLKGHVRISNKANSNDFAIFSITGISTNNGTYFTVPVSYVSGTATGFDNLEDIIVTFARTGDKGDIGFTGSRGNTGFTGSRGTDGVIGVDGAQGAVGFTGSRGNTGFTGSRGTDGTIGSDGANGTNGFTGSQGDIGFTGSQGIEGESSFVFSNNPPPNPEIGDRWYDTTLGFEFVWVNDGDTAQWVEITTAGNGERGFTGSAGFGVVTFLTRNYVGNGSTATFTITQGLGVDNVFVFENGVMQFPITDYTITGANLSFTTVPASGVAIQIRELNNAGSQGGGGGAADIAIYDTGNLLTSTVASLDFVGPGVTATNIGNAVTVTITGGGGGSSSIYSRTAITATGGQTSFAVAYTVGFLEVYFNGVLLNAVDYIATNGSTVVLSSPAVAGDIVEFIAYTATASVAEIPVATFNSTNLTANLAITAGYSAVSVGPISVADGVSISIADGQKWVIL